MCKGFWVSEKERVNLNDLGNLPQKMTLKCIEEDNCTFYLTYAFNKDIEEFELLDIQTWHTHNLVSLKRKREKKEAEWQFDASDYNYVPILQKLWRIWEFPAKV